MVAFLGIVLAGAALVLGSARGAGSADEVHWTITGQTSVTLHWRAGDAVVHYGSTPKLGQSAPAAAPTPQPFSNPGPFREARLQGLKEDTVYYYSIGGGPVHTFRTPPRRGSSGFTFHVQGDIGNSHNWKRVATLQSMIAAGRPRFVLCVGDLTYANAAGQRSVQDHFNDMMKWSRDAAYMPAWGNHEYDEPGDDDLRNYKGRFDLPNPQASPSDSRYPHTGGGEDWYWFDYGNVRFIAYPEPWSGAWPDWSEKVRPVMEHAQRDSAIEFIVTFGHQPAYSSGYHEGEPKLQEMLGPLGVRHGKYVLNLNGHSHNYERSHPQRGVVHITAGTGGSDLEETSDPRCLWKGGCPPPAWSAFRAMHHVVVEIRVAAGRIDGRVLCGPAGDHDDNQNDIACPRGSTIDSFTILPRDATQGTRGAAGGARRSSL